MCGPDSPPAYTPPAVPEAPKPMESPEKSANPASTSNAVNAQKKGRNSLKIDLAGDSANGLSIPS